MKEEIKSTGEIDWEKVSLLLKIGILGAFINLAGDMRRWVGVLGIRA